MAKYKYNYNAFGSIYLESSDTYTRIELNRITRFLFGEGGSLNQVFNCGVGAFIKFQSNPKINKERAYLTTKIFRYCKNKNIPINEKNFPRKDCQDYASVTFEDFLNHINYEKIQESEDTL